MKLPQLITDMKTISFCIAYKHTSLFKICMNLKKFPEHKSELTYKHLNVESQRGQVMD